MARGLSCVVVAHDYQVQGLDGNGNSAFAFPLSIDMSILALEHHNTLSGMDTQPLVGAPSHKACLKRKKVNAHDDDRIILYPNYR